ncbi:hypothetical protein SKA34_12480 [Photobacterium sp. SKA34]|uniref:hypothetical protein n=1 Tax=Photobacterium sp. SKA34 TaxID=121723 RepID=UPI00006B41A1|nr:hypothetical protein [Photobacterium sp. SKA34]EAR56708.1 hypothetical protein SKA34_12480 [Photobacterium sp. SKA34]
MANRVHFPLNKHVYWLLGFLFLSGCSTASTYAVRKPLDVNVIANLPEVLNESSGLAVINGHVWSHNDSGSLNQIYQLSSNFQTVTKTVTVKRSKNYDWEDLAQSKRYLYIGDTGNNSTRRDGGVIYKVPLVSLEKGSSVTPITTIRYRFKDFKPGKTYQHNFDSEAITVVGDQLWLFSKNWQNEHTKLYRISTTKSNQTVSPVGDYLTEGLITSADYNDKTSTLALLGYRKDIFLGYSFIWLVKVKNNQLDWSTAKYKRLRIYSQWEAVNWYKDKKLLITSEKNPLTKAMIATVDVSSLNNASE